MALTFYLKGFTWKDLVQSDLPRWLANTVLSPTVGATTVTALHRGSIFCCCGQELSDQAQLANYTDYYENDGRWRDNQSTTYQQ